MNGKGHWERRAKEKNSFEGADPNEQKRGRDHMMNERTIETLTQENRNGNENGLAMRYGYRMCSR
jgi:hypothetical protein